MTTSHDAKPTHSCVCSLMAIINFTVVSRTDRQYFNAFEAMKTEGKFQYQKVNLHLGEPPLEPQDVESTVGEVLDADARVYNNLTFYFADNWRVEIERPKDKNPAFDAVSLHRP